MRFMIIVRATALSESETKPDDIDPKVMAAMADYHQQLAEAGVLLDGNGLKPSRDGWRIRWSGLCSGPTARRNSICHRTRQRRSGRSRCCRSTARTHAPRPTGAISPSCR